MQLHIKSLMSDNGIISEEPGYLTKDSILKRLTPSPDKAPLIEWGENLTTNNIDGQKFVNSWFCDLHMGGQVSLSSKEPLTELEWGKVFEILPGEFGLLITEESVNLPNDLAAFISLRFSIALRGLVNISGRHVDPGYAGKLIFSVYNAGSTPVLIRRGDPIFMITFAKLDHLAPERLNATFSKIDSIKPEWMTYVRGPPVSLLRLSTRVDKLELKFNVFIGILTTVAIAVIGAIVTFALGII